MTDIAFVNAAYLGATGNVTSFSANYTVGAGSNLLIAAISGGHSGTDLLLTVTYGGQNMTVIDVQQPSGGLWGYLCMLLNPPTGSNSLATTWAIGSGSGPDVIILTAADYSGVNAYDNVTNKTTFATGTTPISVALTPNSDRAWSISQFQGFDAAANPIAGANTVLRIAEPLGNFARIGICDSGGPITPPASYTLNINYPSDLSPEGMIAAAFAPVPSGPAGPILTPMPLLHM